MAAAVRYDCTVVLHHLDLRYRDSVLLFAVLANFSQFGSRVVISPVVPAIIAEFGATKSTIGLALTGMWAAYALLQYPSGVLADRYGERRMVLLALGFVGAGSILLSMAPSLPLFALFALLLGAGAGLYFVGATSLLTKLYDETGGPLSIHAAGGSLSGLIAPVLAGYLASWYGWRAAMLVGAVVAFPALVLFARWVRPTTPATPGTPLREGFDPTALVRLASRPGVAFTIALSAVGMFTFQAVASFLPTFLIEFHGFTTRQGSVAFGGLFLLSALGGPVMGRLSDVVGRDAVLGVDFLVTASGLVVLVVSPGVAVTVVGVGLLGVGMTWFGALQARLMDQFTDDERGTGFGTGRTVFILLGASGSAVTGWLADHHGWTVAYGVVVGLLLAGVLALVVATLLRRH